MSIQVKKAGAYAEIVGMFHKRAGVYESAQGVFAKVGGAYQGVLSAGSTDPHFDKVQLLLHFEGANDSTVFTDSSGSPKTVTPSGNAKITTSDFAFGTSSMILDGTGDFLTVTGFTGWNIRTTPFTIETFAKRANGGTQFFMCGAETVGELITSNAQDLYFGTVGGTMYVGDGSTNNIGVGNSISDTEFQHIELSFDGTTYRYFVAGALIAQSTTLLKSANITAIQIGARSQEGHYHNGKIDEYRITVGVARNVETFIPPIGPFPNA